MEKYFGEKQERFSFRKLSVGLVSATISSLFFMSVLASSSVDAQETAGVHYKYVADSELSSEEKKQLVYDIPTYVENDDETYYLVYKLNSQNQLAELPNTGSKNERQALVAGASLAALGILIFAVSKKKVKNKTVLHLVLVAGMGNGVLVSVHALENHLLLNYNTDYELTSGEKLPLPKEISGYTYIGYIKEGKTTSDFEVSNQEKSAATPTKQQKVDYNVTPNFVDHPSTVQAIQEQTPVSSTKPTEVQVVEKPFSTELINPRKEEKQSSDSQEQLAEHKNLETKKEEKISPKEKTGVNTLNPQDEVLSGQLNKPELLYRDETIETKIDFQEEIQENPDLAEGTVRVKQEGALGKKVEIVRIFSVNNEEVSREIISTSTTAPVSRIVEKGTKKAQVIKEQAETGAEHKEVQSGAIVEPAIQPELPAAVLTDKGESAVQPELPEAVVSDKGVPEVQPALPEAVMTDKGDPEQVEPLPEYTGVQAGAIVEPEKVEPEYAGVQAGAIVEPEQVAPLPEYTGVQAGAIVEPEKVEAPKEYTGVQAGAIVEPEKVEAPKEYTGVQAGAIVEPEKVEPSKESTRLQVADPTQRFGSVDDLNKYMHNMFDVIYMLEILEGKAVAKLDTNQKYDLLRKIENEYKPDPDGNSVYATNVVRRLKPEELTKLTTFNSLIEHDIITRRGYVDEATYKRNGYYTINLFSPIYSALSSKIGTPGDLMGRRIAFELLAAKGYKDGMVPYISNQYEKEAKAQGKVITSYGKQIGLVTDEIVLSKVFNNQYNSWIDFKKDMYKEREDKFGKLNKVSFIDPNGSWARQQKVTIDNINRLEKMIEDAVKFDAEDEVAKLYPETNSRVLKLKKAIFKAYLDQTGDFRSSIFENKK
ncbi:TPA: ZmpA/ZmpB/ZmpC family metallo-endopeptidase [Streptococcus pneumoniae]